MWNKAQSKLMKNVVSGELKAIKQSQEIIETQNRNWELEQELKAL